MPCPYKFSGDPDYKCPHQSYAISFGRCLFHQPKLTLQEMAGLSEVESRNLHEVISSFKRYWDELLDKIKKGEMAPDFRGFQFFHPVDFSRFRFAQPADFREAKFLAGADFTEAEFIKGADFTSASFRGEVRLVHTDFGPSADFSRLTVHEDSTVIFERANLENVAFAFTNVERFVFRHVYWPQSNPLWNRCFGSSKFVSWLGGLLSPKRRMLHDEKSLLNGPTPKGRSPTKNWETVAETYRQLVINHERKRDFDAAEEFHIGEMDARRRMARIHHGPLAGIGYRLYDWLSRYGTSYVRALLVFLIIFFSMSAGFLLGGFEETRPDTAFVSGSRHVIHYCLFPGPSCPCPSPKQWFQDYRKACLLSLEILTFQRERHFEPIGAGRWLSPIAVLSFTGQAALVLLAVRRKFRR